MRHINLSILSAAALLSLVACSDAPPVGSVPMGHPLEAAMVAATAEIDFHRANVSSSDSMGNLYHELFRHDVEASPIYREIDARIDDMTLCMNRSVRGELEALVAGITATERGRDEALGAATDIESAVRIADAYAAGIEDSLNRIHSISLQQSACF